ncbi:MAG: hypothetical protein GY817_02070 [bacterium]|nr:hypothetical protein [bacterium]
MKQIKKIIKLGTLILIISCSNNSGQKAMLKFGDVSKGYTDKKFKSTAPDYRIVCEGLNLEAECQDCKKKVWAKIDIDDRYKGKKVYDYKKGYIVENGFNIGLLVGDCYCSNCSTQIEPENVQRLGFHKCKYFIYGRKLKESKKTKIDGVTLTEDGFRHFDIGKLIWWGSIEVAVWK